MPAAPSKHSMLPPWPLEELSDGFWSDLVLKAEIFLQGTGDRPSVDPGSLEQKILLGRAELLGSKILVLK